MIAMEQMHSTSPVTRRAALLGLSALALAGCVAQSDPAGPLIMHPAQDTTSFIMPDGARLPYRVWRPTGEVRAVVLALHGFNDSRDAFEYPGPGLAAAGILLVAPDQRGFGTAPGRGLWAGKDTMVDDAVTMAALLRARHPGKRLLMMGESMGGAVVMCAATERGPQVDGYVLLAPAVWGRARMNFLMQGGLWAASTFLPGLAVGAGPIRVTPSDNREALIRLSRDPLTLRTTRFDTLRGLVDLMDAALAAAPSFTAPGLFLYGGRDELVPPRATRAMWRSLPPSAIRAFYPNGYHLLTRDLDRAQPNADIAAYILDGSVPLAAQQTATAWLASEA
jgi:acylglycerol lipase